VDLADFQSLADENEGYRFCLLGVDVLSRRVFAVPIKSKSTKDMFEGFEELFKQMPHLPSEIYSDRGLEFESGEMKRYFEEKGIEKFSARSSYVKAAVAERFIRSLKLRLYRWFSEKNSLKWTKVLPEIVNAMNNTVNAATGMTPNEVNPKNASVLWDKLYREYLYPETKRRATKFKANDAVRLAKKKQTFEKGYLANYSGFFLIIFQ
jgi:hypothetical protein